MCLARKKLAFGFLRKEIVSVGVNSTSVRSVDRLSGTNSFHQFLLGILTYVPAPERLHKYREDFGRPKITSTSLNPNTVFVDSSIKF